MSFATNKAKENFAMFSLTHSGVVHSGHNFFHKRAKSLKNNMSMYETGINFNNKYGNKFDNSAKGQYKPKASYY